MNRTQIIANVVADAELKGNEKKFVTFSVAVNESYVDKNGNKVEKSTYFDCIKFSDSEKLKNAIKKGQKLYIEGVVSVDAYIGKDGQAKANLKLKVDNIEWCGSPKGDGQSQSQSQPQPQPQQQGEAAKTLSSGTDDSLPF